MLYKLFFFTLAFSSVIYLILGVIKLIKTFPMMDTRTVTGRLIDARITKQNIMSHEEFRVNNEYLYYTYEVNGITHGGSMVSSINDYVRRQKLKSLSERYGKEGEFEIPIYVSNLDSRKSYLISSEEVKNPQILVAFISLFMAIVVFFIM
jgi:hypothetical protein